MLIWINIAFWIRTIYLNFALLINQLISSISDSKVVSVLKADENLEFSTFSSVLPKTANTALEWSEKKIYQRF